MKLQNWRIPHQERKRTSECIEILHFFFTLRNFACFLQFFLKCQTDIA